MIYPKIPLAQSIIEICRAKGITNIVISPGSRNAPLTIGFANNPAFTCYSIVDERCAAFFGMGMAQQVKKPVALVCTSGSALLNYYPAIAEAFYSQIPLIVISADRPHDKIDIGDGQTIRQENVYANHILYNANLLEDASLENDRKINEAINTAITQKGPVHINAPFEEPLYETVEELKVSPLLIENSAEDNPGYDIQPFAEKWHAAKKKLILVGVNDPGTVDSVIIQQLAEDPSVVVMTETPSNFYHPTFISNIDTIITPFGHEDFEAWRPEILLTFGGMVVSKRVKAWLRKYKAQEHWHIDNLRAYDTFSSLTYHVTEEPNVFLHKLLQHNNSRTESNYRKMAQDLAAYRKSRHTAYLAKIPFSDFKAFDSILRVLPENSQLQISNSSAIRYAQLFENKPEVEVFCNRGTSGIDGSTSTAIGAAVGSGKETILITGDVGFFYDSNALWNNYIPKDFKVILINNRGGGIFRILPGHDETPVFNTFFETTHNLTAEHLAKMYGFAYQTASNEEELKEQLELLMQEDDGPKLLEVFTPMLENDKILLQYFKELV